MEYNPVFERQLDQLKGEKAVLVKRLDWKSTETNKLNQKLSKVQNQVKSLEQKVKKKEQRYKTLEQQLVKAQAVRKQTCRNYHLLKFVNPKEYRCDECNKCCYEGGWTCSKGCDYDQCEECYSKFMSPEQKIIKQLESKVTKAEEKYQAVCDHNKMLKENTELPKCPSGHPFDYNPKQRQCSVCYKHATGGYTCAVSCSYVLCPTCYKNQILNIKEKGPNFNEGMEKEIAKVKEQMKGAERMNLILMENVYLPQCAASHNLKPYIRNMQCNTCYKHYDEGYTCAISCSYHLCTDCYKIQLQKIKEKGPNFNNTMEKEIKKLKQYLKLVEKMNFQLMENVNLPKCGGNHNLKPYAHHLQCNICHQNCDDGYTCAVSCSYHLCSDCYVKKMNELRGQKQVSKNQLNHPLQQDTAPMLKRQISGYQKEIQLLQTQTQSFGQQCQKQQMHIENLKSVNQSLKREIEEFKIQIQKLQGSKEKPKCPQGHVLVHNSNRRYNCDSCRKSGFYNGGYQCAPKCNYDLCSNCYARQQSRLCQPNLVKLQSPLCRKGHILEFNTTRSYGCDGCKARGFKNGGYQCLARCNYDLCQMCFEEQNSKIQQIKAQMKQTEIGNQRQQTSKQLKEIQILKFENQKLKSEIEKSKLKRPQELQGSKEKPKCPQFHPMVHDNQWRLCLFCNIMLAGGYTCTGLCNYNICNECYQKQLPNLKDDNGKKQLQEQVNRLLQQNDQLKFQIKNLHEEMRKLKEQGQQNQMIMENADLPKCDANHPLKQYKNKFKCTNCNDSYDFGYACSSNCSYCLCTDCYHNKLNLFKMSQSLKKESKGAEQQQLLKGSFEDPLGNIVDEQQELSKDEIKILTQINSVLMENADLPKCGSNHPLKYSPDKSHYCKTCKKEAFSNEGYICSKGCNFCKCTSCYLKELKENQGKGDEQLQEKCYRLNVQNEQQTEEIDFLKQFTGQQKQEIAVLEKQVNEIECGVPSKDEIKVQQHQYSALQEQFSQKSEELNNLSKEFELHKCQGNQKVPEEEQKIETPKDSKENVKDIKVLENSGKPVEKRESIGIFIENGKKISRNSFEGRIGEVKVEIRKVECKDGAEMKNLDAMILMWQQCESEFIAKLYGSIKVPLELDQKTTLILISQYPTATIFEKFVINKQDFTTSEIIDFAVQLLKGINFIHEKGCVVGNLHPEAIIIEDKKVLLADLGQTAKIGETSQIFQGDTFYQAPEQFIKNKSGSLVCDFKSDSYAFGGILYTMLMGWKPWHKSTADQLKAKLFMRKSFLKENPLTCDKKEIFEEIISSCLSYSPGDRPEIDHLVQTLEIFSQNLDTFQ